MRRTSSYSIPPGIQRHGAIGQGDTTSGIAHPDPARRSVTHVYLKQESFGERCRSTRCRRCTVRFAFTCCSVRSKQPGRSDLAFALARADRSSAAYEGGRSRDRGPLGLGAPATGSRCRTRSKADHLPRLLKPLFLGGIGSSPTASLPSMVVSFRFFRVSSIHKPTRNPKESRPCHCKPNSMRSRPTSKPASRPTVFLVP